MAEKQEHEEVAKTKLVKEEKVTNSEGALVIEDDRRRKWVIWSVIGGFIILLLLVASAIFVVHTLRDRTASTNRPSLQVSQRGGFGRGYASGSFYSQSTSTDGPTTTTTSQKYTVTTGVVTQVNSGNVIVAGNGKTQTITTNSSTTYYGDTKPAVNDTVRIVGTADSNDKVTATEIAVLNN